MSLKVDTLTTLLEIKAFMVVEHDDDDALLNALHLAAERRFQNFVQRPTIAAEETDYFDGGKGRIFLPSYPISSDADLTVVDTKGLVDESANETLAAAYYRIYNQKGTLQRATTHGQPKVWAPGCKRWKITWTGGLDQLPNWGTDHRPPLEQSIKLLVVDWYDKGSQVLSQGSRGAIKPSDLPLPIEVQVIWDNYQPLGL